MSKMKESRGPGGNYSIAARTIATFSNKSVAIWLKSVRPRAKMLPLFLPKPRDVVAGFRVMGLLSFLGGVLDLSFEGVEPATPEWSVVCGGIKRETWA
eukprot:5122118-Amphidinium_carterae.2